jgi:hypothetical protein
MSVAAVCRMCAPSFGARSPAMLLLVWPSAGFNWRCDLSRSPPRTAKTTASLARLSCVATTTTTAIPAMVHVLTRACIALHPRDRCCARWLDGMFRGCRVCICHTQTRSLSLTSLSMHTGVPLRSAPSPRTSIHQQRTHRRKVCVQAHYGGDTELPNTALAAANRGSERNGLAGAAGSARSVCPFANAATPNNAECLS